MFNTTHARRLHPSTVLKVLKVLMVLLVSSASEDIHIY